MVFPGVGPNWDGWWVSVFSQLVVDCCSRGPMAVFSAWLSGVARAEAQQSIPWGVIILTYTALRIITNYLQHNCLMTFHFLTILALGRHRRELWRISWCWHWPDWWSVRARTPWSNLAMLSDQTSNSDKSGEGRWSRMIEDCVRLTTILAPRVP